MQKVSGEKLSRWNWKVQVSTRGVGVYRSRTSEGVWLQHQWRLVKQTPRLQQALTYPDCIWIQDPTENPSHICLGKLKHFETFLKSWSISAHGVVCTLGGGLSDPITILLHCVLGAFTPVQYFHVVKHDLTLKTCCNMVKVINLLLDVEVAPSPLW